MMGIGNVTTEELVYDEKGRLLNDGTWEYKPPCSKTIPQVTLHSQALVICRESPTCMTFVMQLCIVTPSLIRLIAFMVDLTLLQVITCNQFSNAK